MAGIELKVGGMACEGCADAVKRAIAAADPKAVVKVDLASKQVQVESAAGKDAVAAAITRAGYEILGEAKSA